MSPVRFSLASVLSLAILTACVADAPRSGVSGGDVASTPAPATNAANAASADVKATPAAAKLLSELSRYSMTEKK